jgi:hypothetical protein
MINKILNNYFENFLIFSLIFLDLFRDKSKMMNFDKEHFEYFQGTHNFYFNLRNPKHLKKVLKENIELTTNDSKETDLELILNIIPDIILSGILFFLKSKNIMYNHSMRIKELLVKTYSILKDKIYQPILEDLIINALNSPNQSNSMNHELLFDLLNSNEYLTNKINNEMLNIAINYLNNIAEKPNFIKENQHIQYSLRILVYCSHNYELKERKIIIKLFKKFIGNSLIETLKWIFTYVEWEVRYNKDFNVNWLAYSFDLLLSHFKGKTKLETKDKSICKFRSLCFNNNENFNMNIDDFYYDKN